MSVYESNGARHSRRPSRRVAFYDVDGTLCGLNLVHLTLFVLANLGEWSARISYLLRFAARAPALYFAEKNDRRLLNAVLFESYRGISRDRLTALGDEYCERVLFDRLYPGAVELLDANRRAGIEPVLVTGSPEFIVAPLACHLGVSEFAANRLQMRAGRATGRLAEPIMAGPEKAQWCREYAAERRMNLADCWGYADSYYDLPFLSALGHPVVVNPDRRLYAMAHNRQWPVVRFEQKRLEHAAEGEMEANGDGAA
ncbi:MAG: HAD family hydrolase [Candidatus Binataceae bacterium]